MEALIRGELLSIDRLEPRAERFAAAARVTTGPHTRTPLARRLQDNSRALADAYRDVEQAVREERALLVRCWLPFRVERESSETVIRRRLGHASTRPPRSRRRGIARHAITPP